MCCRERSILGSVAQALSVRPVALRVELVRKRPLIAERSQVVAYFSTPDCASQTSEPVTQFSGQGY
jgi:hypothetical protein